MCGVYAVEVVLAALVDASGLADLVAALCVKDVGSWPSA